MFVPLIGSLLLVFIYGGLIFWIWKGFKQNQFHHPFTPLNISLSVIIAARNEATGIQKCIQSILQNDVKGKDFEIIVVDDHSTDNTFEFAAAFTSSNVKVVKLPDGITGKKSAIQYAVNLAKHDVILCTDADCEVSTEWISGHMDAYRNEKVAFCTGLVLPKQTGSRLYNFQWLDFASTMVITANGIFRNTYHLANGANMSFRKSAFLTINGFENNKERASGDDIFLIQNLAKQYKVGFISAPMSTVVTKSEPLWADFFIQRKRWATKALASPDKNVMIIQGFVFLYALATLLTLVLVLFIPVEAGLSFFILMLGKMIVDYLFLRQVSYHFKRPEAMGTFLHSFLMYYVHILYSGWNAAFPSRYLWKSRSAK
jgi:cellulose synthase/poly-beta-1,6-N-acetylglucosamine synthase-like glycosyltransferase